MFSSFSDDPRAVTDAIAQPDLSRRVARTFVSGLVAMAASSALGGCAILHDVGQWFHRDRPPPPAIATPVETPPPPPTQVPKPKPEKLERLAEVDPNTLIGLDPPTVEKVLGTPSKISKSDISLVWTFSAPNCSFQIFFYPDLKTSAFHALKYGGIDGNGAQLAMSEVCIRGILTAKANAPG
jgi:hypothetical protein